MPSIYLPEFLNLEIFNIIKKGTFWKRITLQNIQIRTAIRVLKQRQEMPLKADILFEPAPEDRVTTRQHIPRDGCAALAGARRSVSCLSNTSICDSCSKSLSLQANVRHFTVSWGQMGRIAKDRQGHRPCSFTGRNDALWPRGKMGSVFLCCEKAAEACAQGMDLHWTCNVV